MLAIPFFLSNTDNSSSMMSIYYKDFQIFPFQIQELFFFFLKKFQLNCIWNPFINRLALIDGNVDDGNELSHSEPLFLCLCQLWAPLEKF